MTATSAHEAEPVTIPEPASGVPDAPARESSSDTLLVERTRARDVDAFLELWTRHADAAARVAARLLPPGARTESVVNDAFASVLLDITQDRDPMRPFRVIVYQAVCRLVGSVDVDDLPQVLRALGHLPLRSQAVLWYHDVERLPMAEVERLVGDGPAELRTVRRHALLSLRAEWAIEKVMDPEVADACAWCVTRLRARSAGWLPAPAKQRFDRHVRSCAHCHEFLEQVDDIPGALRAAAVGVLGAA